MTTREFNEMFHQLNSRGTYYFMLSLRCFTMNVPVREEHRRPRVMYTFTDHTATEENNSLILSNEHFNSTTS